MKSRLSLIFAALVVLLGGMVWMMQDRLQGPSGAQTAALPTVALRMESSIDQPAAATTAAVPAAATESPIAPAKPAPMVHVDPSGDVKYVARSGDTASQLAIALLGSDSKDNRDTVIAANPSLQPNPDRVLEGVTYSSVPASDPITATIAKEDAGRAHAATDEKATEKAPLAGAGPEMKYVAQSGDTVHVLAASLLGGDTKANRESIIAGNASLQQDPDHLVAGKSYTILAPNGLAADPHATPAKAPTSQPDADELVKVSMGRTLRYTAKPGDTVSKLAVALLGSDTSANRDLIIKSNASLKQDPDHLVAGRTYWIAAPTADATP